MKDVSSLFNREEFPPLCAFSFAVSLLEDPEFLFPYAVLELASPKEVFDVPLLFASPLLLLLVPLALLLLPSVPAVYFAASYF